MTAARVLPRRYHHLAASQRRPRVVSTPNRARPRNTTSVSVAATSSARRSLGNEPRPVSAACASCSGPPAKSCSRTVADKSAGKYAPTTSRHPRACSDARCAQAQAAEAGQHDVGERKGRLPHRSTMSGRRGEGHRRGDSDDLLIAARLNLTELTGCAGRSLPRSRPPGPRVWCAWGVAEKHSHAIATFRRAANRGSHVGHARCLVPGR